MKKRFSIKNKLLIVFGLLIFAVGFTLAFLGTRTARQAVVEKIETHLKDKATDVAEVLDGRVNTMFQFLEGITRMPALRDDTVSFREKMKLLAQEAKFNSVISELYIADKNGTVYNLDGTNGSYSGQEWFKTGREEKKTTAEPYIDETQNNKMFMTFSLPVYDDNKNLIGVLAADIDGLWLSEQVKDIIVGQTGYCYILGAMGNIIGHNNTELVKKQQNYQDAAKTDKSFTSLGAFEKMAVEIDEP